MSSFLCSEKHFNTIVVWAVQNSLIEPAKAVETANLLFECNCAAMESLYVHRTWAPPNESVIEQLARARAFVADEPNADRLCEMARIARGPEITHPQAHSLLECLDYQCSEGNVLETHAGAPILKSLLESAKQLSNGIRAEE